MSPPALAGVIPGLLASAFWGWNDVLISQVVARSGLFRTLVVGQVAAVAVFLPVMAWDRAAHPTLAVTLGLLAVGALGAVAYVALYEALRLGPLSRVSPIVASYGVVTVLLAVVVVRDVTGPVEGAAIATTLAGAMLLARGRDGRSARTTARGPLLALLCMVVFGLQNFLIGFLARQVGWIFVTGYSRVGLLLAIVLYSGVQPAPVRVRGFATTAAVALAALTGLLDVAAVAAFAFGSQVGSISVTSTIAATYVLVPVAVGLLSRREVLTASGRVALTATLLGVLLLASR